MMKYFIGVLLLVLTTFAQAAPTYVISVIDQQAKDIYLMLTGPDVIADGAVGHLYRTGENIVCKYTDADMDDNKGKSIPRQDVRRYSCQLTLDRNGRVFVIKK